VKPGQAQALLIVIDRNSDEWPTAYLQPARGEDRSK
jgi:hypothetical protein